MTAFITSSELRADSKNQAAADEAALERAVEIACGMVEDGWEMKGSTFPGVGPVLYATISDERVVGGVTKYRVRGLTTVADWRTGSALDPADYTAEGQLLRRRDGGSITRPLAVTYTTGHADDGDPAPAWARHAALILAAWVASRRVKVPQQTDQSSALPLMEAAEILSQHALSPLGFA